jgi:ADP-heptose:LPS heptosyltransferase/GT2 family glycosyltransferase
LAHVPRVLCARGSAEDSQEDEALALKAALARRRIKADVEPGAVASTWRVRRHQARRRRTGSDIVAGLVSIIIPTCSAKDLVRGAITSIRATTAPLPGGEKRVEIVVVDNTPQAEKRARAWLRKNADTVVDMPGPFNWSRFNNAGAAAAQGEFLLFLNDDIEISQPDWLDALLEHAQRPEVGVVGARLLYPQGTVQHAGQYLANGHARHAFRFADASNPGPFGLASVARDVISVTGACQMMHRRVFKRLGGFEEAHSIVNNDLDFCLRCRQAGLAVIYTPHATLVHHELASRAELDDVFDEARFSTAWRHRFLAGDPFRNPHLAPDSDFYGAEPEPAVTLHAGRRLPRAKNVLRILVVKLDHIGDFLTCLPALQALRAHFAQAKIDLLVPSATASLIGHARTIDASLAVDEVTVFDFFHARSGEGSKMLGDAELEALKARLAPKNYDLAIDLRMHPDTRRVLPYTGARFLAGYDHDKRFPFLDVALEWEGDTKLVRKRAHISERLTQLVSAVADAGRDIFSAVAPPAYEASAAAAAQVPAWAALSAKFYARPIACIHPGVGNVVRQWPASSYAALIDLLGMELGLHAVLVGSADEAPIADEILRRVRDPARVQSLVGRVKLAQLPAVMRACVLFVGNNSGPQHLAASLGLPAIGIHSGVVDAAEWAPLGTQAMAIRRRMVCSPCYLEFASDCPRDLACLTGLLPRDVFAACRRLLAGKI